MKPLSESLLSEDLQTVATQLSRSLSLYHGLPESLNLLPGGIGVYFTVKISEYLKYSLADQVRLFKITNYNFLDVERNVVCLARSGDKSCSTGSIAGIMLDKLAIPCSNIREKLFRSYLNSLLLNTPNPFIHRGAMHDKLPCIIDYLYRRNFSICQKASRSRLRSCFLRSGLNSSISTLAAELMPVAYVEQFYQLFEYSRHLKIKSLYTSIYGLMEDPVVAIAVSLSSPTLFYVQHGGAYCFMKHWAHYLERNSCDKMIYWGLGDCNVLPTRYNSAFKNPIKKLVRNGKILLNKAFRIDILLVVGEIPSTLTLEALEAINKIVADALGRQPTIHVSLHPKALLDDKNLEFIRKCKKIGYTTSRGISSEKHVSSRLVIYDSIQHTLMYERVIHNNPFLIIENPNVQVDLCFDLAAEFLKLLVEKSIYINLGDIKSIETIFSAYPPTCANTFRAKFAAARSIIMRNPTLQTFSRSSYTQKHS